MYEIYEQPDGTYVGHCRIQDGTEKFTAATLKEAVKEMREHARILNGMKKLKKADIAFYRLQVPTEPQWIKGEIK